MKKILITFSTIFGIGLSYSQATDTENYIQTRTYLEPVTTTSSTAKQVHTVQYFDGLGRPKQVVGVKASPLGNDVITHIEYDNFGRQVFDFLPVPQSNTANGAISTDPLSNAIQQDIYGNERIWSKKEFEASPLDRILEQKQVGNAWDSKPVKFNYDANTVGEVIRFTTVTTWVNNATKSQIINSGSYGTAQLYKNTVTDEDGNKTIEFKNGEGQTILVRKVVSDSENADTYYVYNEYNQLAFVIPPLASIATLDEVALNNLCYQYRYDGRSRLVEKKLPGKGWELMVYDKNDRLILSQDVMLGTVNNNFTKKGWLFTKYDKFGRVVYTGFFANTASRTSMQTALNNMNSGNVESRNTTPFTLNGMDVYYTKTAFPTGSMTILSINYYDTYPALPPNVTVPSSVFGQSVITDNLNNDVNTKSLPLASYVKNIENDNWTKSFTWYDNKGRTIGTHSVNYLGGSTKTESQLDFSGVVKQMITRHKRLDSDTEKVIIENFEYDHQNRLKLHKHQVDNNPVEYLAQNDYNELSQVKNKKVGGLSAGNGLQSVDYKYNIRGWITNINDPANLNGKLFGYEIRYNERVGEESPDPLETGLKVLPRFNGNIAEIDWRTGTNPNENLRRYGYVYDGLNRLKAGFYQNEVNPSASEYYEKLTYDLNGNITNLKRTAAKGENTVAGLIDNLTYKYNYSATGNQLNSIIDASQNYDGYPGGGSTITYDLNGNMTKHLDKGLQKISYNFLNLPNYMGDEGTSLPKGSAFIYRADGTKLKKTYSFRKIGDFGTISYAQTETDYLDGFQYVLESGGVWCIDCPPPSPTLQFLPTSEGYFDFVKNKYIYNYTDHLGNTRLSYFHNGSGIEVLEENNYYPFGLKHTGYNILPGNSNYNYKFQEQELQETGFYSFKWRQYMPDLGRFFNVDPLSEKYEYQSHYNFSENSVISYRELEGLEKVLAIFYTGGVQGGGKTVPHSSLAGTTGKLFDYASFNAKSKGYEFTGAIIAPGIVYEPSVANGMDFIESNYEKGDIILTYGFSYGADSTMRLGEELNDENIPVQLSMIVDSSDGIFKNSTLKTNVSENTKEVLNTYQTTPDPNTGAKGVPLTPDNKSKTTIVNTNLTSPDVNHQNIDEKALDANKKAIDNVIPNR